MNKKDIEYRLKTKISKRHTVFRQIICTETTIHVLWEMLINIFKKSKKEKKYNNYKCELTGDETGSKFDVTGGVT